MTTPTGTSVVILVPYRPASDRHRWLWDMVQPHLEQFGWPIFTGQPQSERWKRADAVNDAAAKAGDWDIAFIADCDTLTDPAGIRRAVTWVADSHGAVRPHEQRFMLDQKQSIQAVQRGTASLDHSRLKAPYAGGGLDIVHRDAWDAVANARGTPGKAFDESYVGWGWEDSHFHLDLILHASWDRLPGVAYHLHHESTDPVVNRESRMRFQAAQREHRKVLEMWAAPKGLRQPMAVL